MNSYQRAAEVSAGPEDGRRGKTGGSSVSYASACSTSTWLRRDSRLLLPLLMGMGVSVVLMLWGAARFPPSRCFRRHKHRIFYEHPTACSLRQVRT